MNDTDNPVDPPKLEANTRSGREAREDACERIAISFGFFSDWLRKCHAFYVDQSLSAIKQN